MHNFFDYISFLIGFIKTVIEKAGMVFENPKTYVFKVSMINLTYHYNTSHIYHRSLEILSAHYSNIMNKNVIYSITSRNKCL